MKSLLFIIISIAFLHTYSNAKIWRVNNNPGVQADYTTAQQAHDGAAAGDTLYFEHSASTYGDLLMSKPLTLIGSGAFGHLNPNQQYNMDAAYLEWISLRPSAAGAVISVNNLAIYDTASNVTITRCWTREQVVFYNADNCIVSEAFPRYITCRISIGENTNNIIIRNSIMAGISAGPFASSDGSGTTGTCYSYSNLICYNNTITGTVAAAGTFYNNIMWQINTDASSPVNNNIFVGEGINSTRRNSTSTQGCGGNLLTTFTETDGNKFNNPITSILAEHPNNIQLWDIGYTLHPNSPAKGAGTGGTDCGATGGANPYRFGLQPAIPAIYKLNVAVPPTGNTINVTLSTKSNN